MDVAIRRREQEVWQACDDLWALVGDLKQLTGDAIRERLLTLGKSKGSPNEIYRYRKTWMQSRRVQAGAEPNEDQENDPISRAVRLVHEKLQAEAEQEIAILNEVLLAQKAEAEEQKQQSKADMERVLEEYSTLSKELDNLKREGSKIKDEFAAEIDVRKATEQELKRRDVEYRTALRAKEQEQEQAVQVHQKELETLKKCHQDALAALEKNQNLLREENKTLGQKFSEDLNAMRTQLYNLNLLKAKSEEREGIAIAELEKIKIMLRDSTEAREIVAKQLAEMRAVNQVLKSNEARALGEEKKGRYQLKKVELKLARFRAIHS